MHSAHSNPDFKFASNVMLLAGLPGTMIMTFVEGLLHSHAMGKVQPGFMIEWLVRINIIATLTLTACLETSVTRIAHLAGTFHVAICHALACTRMSLRKVSV